MTAMMKCGHAANATRGDGSPVCVICIGIIDGADVVDETPPSLEGRMAKCGSCSATVPSAVDLPFFKHLPGFGFDSYYSGCRGWN